MDPYVKLKKRGEEYKTNSWWGYVKPGVYQAKLTRRATGVAPKGLKHANKVSCSEGDRRESLKKSAFISCCGSSRCILILLILLNPLGISLFISLRGYSPQAWQCIFMFSDSSLWISSVLVYILFSTNNACVLEKICFQSIIVRAVSKL